MSFVRLEREGKQPCHTLLCPEQMGKVLTKLQTPPDSLSLEIQCSAWWRYPCSYQLLVNSSAQLQYYLVTKLKRKEPHVPTCRLAPLFVLKKQLCQRMCGVTGSATSACLGCATDCRHCSCGQTSVFFPLALTFPDLLVLPRHLL